MLHPRRRLPEQRYPRRRLAYRSWYGPILNTKLGSLMSSLHDSLLTGYTVDGAVRTIVLRTEPHQGDGTAAEVKFSGVVAYHFEGDCLQNIIFDITEVPAESIVGDGRAVEERARQFGWPRGWEPGREDLAQFLRRQGCRCFELSSSYGMSGWIAAREMDVLRAGEGK
jgi:hypothetical protein